jgi:hypothetical protein
MENDCVPAILTNLVLLYRRCALGNLSTLDLKDTGLTGTIPSELYVMPLKPVALTENHPHCARIPRSHPCVYCSSSVRGQLLHLRHLGLTGLNLTGTIPPEMYVPT